MILEQEQLLQKARDSLKAAQILLNNNLPAFASTRAYYSMFYIAQAFLLKEGLSFSSHAAVISSFGKEFAKSNRIPVEYHRYLIDAQEKRTEADYTLTPNITREKAQELIEKAKKMIDFFEKHIDLI